MPQHACDMACRSSSAKSLAQPMMPPDKPREQPAMQQAQPRAQSAALRAQARRWPRKPLSQPSPLPSRTQLATLRYRALSEPVARDQLCLHIPHSASLIAKSLPPWHASARSICVPNRGLQSAAMRFPWGLHESKLLPIVGRAPCFGHQLDTCVLHRHFTLISNDEAGRCGSCAVRHPA